MDDGTAPRAAISVVVPGFGRQALLEGAVRSAVTQLEGHDEIVVVDDGSSPPLVLDRAATGGAAVRMIRLPRNRGAAAARNAGIAAARNPLLAFLDSDDTWRPGKLDAQARLIAPGDGLLAVACGWADVGGGGTMLGRRVPRPSRGRADFLAGCWFAPGSTLLIAKAAFETCGPFREDLARLEDYEWFVRFALAGGRLAVADMIGADVRRGGNARSGPVDAAARTILAHHADDPRLTGGERRAMAAWLDLARAQAARNEGAWPRFALLLARSWLRVPRARVQLRDWWTRTR